MKFTVARSSWGWFDTSCPCEGAVPVKMGKLEDWERQTWTIEIGSLEGLMEFISRNGAVVIFGETDSDIEACRPLPKIEIYDDYRE